MKSIKPKNNPTWFSLILIQSFTSLVMSVTFTIPLHLSKMNTNSYNYESVTMDDLMTVNNQTVEDYFNVRGRSGQGYFITVYIGSPQQMMNVLIDTGSSNFAIAAVPDPLIRDYFHINNSSTFQHKNVSIIVPYTMGQWRGFLGNDVIQLENLSSFRTDIACITHAEHFFINGSEWEGILGLAYAEIARPNKHTIPFFDNLVSNKIVSDVFSLQLCGENTKGTSAGSLILGGVDKRFYRDRIRFTPLNRPWYYEVVITGLMVGQEELEIDCKELNNDKTIVDSGTTNLRLPKKVFDEVVASLNRQVKVKDVVPGDFWMGETFMCWAHDPAHLLRGFPKLKLSLVHSKNSIFTLVITPKQYLREVLDSMEDEAGGNKNNTCFKFAITPSETGTVIGAVIMEGFYVVFDRQNRRIGFAKSVCSTKTIKHEFEPEIEGPSPHPDPWSCVYKLEPSKSLQVISYILAGLAVVCALPLIVMLVQWALRRWQHRKLSRLTDSSSVAEE